VRRLRAQRRIGRDLIGRARDGDIVGRHQTGGNRRLGLGAAREQAALDEQKIGATTVLHAHF
jgi:hypothetical protein